VLRPPAGGRRRERPDTCRSDVLDALDGCPDAQPYGATLVAWWTQRTAPRLLAQAACWHKAARCSQAWHHVAICDQRCCPLQGSHRPMQQSAR
jgi:hypothetical protein